jgi:hypothetical protein
MESTELHVDADMLEASLARRLRARAARADSAVEITPEILVSWVREELQALMAEFAFVQGIADTRSLN